MIPEKQKTYKMVFDLACRDLMASSLDGQIEKASLRCQVSRTGRVIEVPFFNETILLTLPTFQFESKQGRNVTLASRILILHYLVKASGQRPSGDKISYEDLPGCRPYLPVFERRVCRPLLAAFGNSRDLFHEAGRSLGGIEEKYGNASFTLKAFPMVPITFILWEGDEEFPPSFKVLFDRTVNSYLPLEDITVISKLASSRILVAARLQATEQI